MSKLVRDRIIEIMEKQGKTPQYHIATDEEYRENLLAKLQEEVAEFLEAKNAEELADILEVIDAICSERHFSKNEILALQEKKRSERGGFTKKIILE